jgi:hypothetical protein
LRQIFIPKYVFEVNHEVNHGVWSEPRN